MKFDDLLCCPACASMFRPLTDEEICPKCEQLEQQRLDEMNRELEG